MVTPGIGLTHVFLMVSYTVLFCSGPFLWLWRDYWLASLSHNASDFMLKHHTKTMYSLSTCIYHEILYLLLLLRIRRFICLPYIFIYQVFCKAKGSAKLMRHSDDGVKNVGQWLSHFQSYDCRSMSIRFKSETGCPLPQYHGISSCILQL